MLALALEHHVVLSWTTVWATMGGMIPLLPEGPRHGFVLRGFHIIGEPERRGVGNGGRGSRWAVWRPGGGAEDGGGSAEHAAAEAPGEGDGIDDLEEVMSSGWEWERRAWRYRLPLYLLARAVVTSGFTRDPT